ncbi:MAG: hypothetical protein HOP15_10215 [Planctomycetes bacterium]|nr:hypothetical protein [Planctomycetota bacterium]
MKTFLLWRARDGAPELAPALVGERLAALYAPILEPGATLTTRSVGDVHLAWIELPVLGFHAPFFEQDEHGWAFAPDYPLNARRLLRAREALPKNDGSVLVRLACELERQRETLLRDLIPPAALIWSRARSDEVRVQNDGLGQAQLYEHEGRGPWALTNRPCALRALGIMLEPVALDWATRFTTHWFPQHTSGFAGISMLAGGTQLRLTRAGIERSRFDPLGEWVHPPARSREDNLELGRHALLNHLSDAMELWEKPSVGLSGGWDSRCVAACLRVLGADFELRVRGQETHFDVLISAELARMAGLPHRIKSEGGIPSATVAGLRASLAKALLWQAGNYTTLKHKNFLAKAGKDRLDGGVVNVMGQHAGIGKADFAKKIRAWEHPEGRFEEHLLAELMADAPPILRPELRDAVRETLRASYRAARDYGLAGRGPLHFFFLNEYTRRWGSATAAGQTGLVVTPFLTPDFIRACYGMPEAELVEKPMHRYITGLHAPDWAAYPYTDQATEDDLRSGLIPPVEVPREEGEAAEQDLPRWRQTARHRKFHYKYYWKDVGLPLLEEAFAQPGFWSELFDPDMAREQWKTCKGAADLLAISHLLPQVLAGKLP